ncbi:MAG: GNAT family N-acetyltransferase [Rhodanobacteraceae bacterium]
MQIRNAIPEDAETIAAAEDETRRAPGLLVAWPGEIPVEAYRARIAELASEGRYIVAEAGGKPVGHAMLGPMPMRGNAHVFKLTLVVHPGKGGRGIGTAMLHDLLAWAEGDPRVGKIELNVRAGNLHARKLYRRFGFIEEARFRDRVRRTDGEFEDDLGMAWFPRRWLAAGGGDKLSPDDAGEQ